MADPGWYQDPQRADLVRWWDGRQWTGHVQPAQPPAAVPAATSRSRAERKELSERDRLAAEVAGLRAQLVDVRATIELQEVGFYDYENPAEHSTRLATELEAVRAQARALVAQKRATVALTQFYFGGSASKGKKFIGDLSKLGLAAYNAEVENCVKTVRAGNIETALKRIERARERVARAGAMVSLAISNEYHHLRRREVELTHLHLAAKQVEKEAERERRAQLAEERRVQAEIEKERAKLVLERERLMLSLGQVTTGGDAQSIERMRARLADVDRAITDVDYRAANLRAGYVYVISNEGSFGPGIVKIGMTRRVEPTERVRELGDASVPFRFDTHALFFADDAVEIESRLHRRFADRVVNKVNARREFFRVTPAEVLEALRAESVELLEYNVDVVNEEWAASRPA